MGQFDIDVPDTLQVNSIEMYSALTKKMFDRDDTSIEAMVSIHAVGNAENNYKDCYITRAYHIDGSGIAYECEGSGMLFDASKGWNTYQRLILPIEKVIDGKEYVSIDFIAPPTWGKDEPYVEHTLDIPFDNINYMDGAYINCFVIEDKPYYVVAQYDTAYCTMPEDYTQDIIVTPNNHFVLKTYDRNYSLVDSVAVPIEESPKGIYRMAAFGRMSDNDLSKGYFGPEDQFSYVVTWVDYHLQSDENTYNFDLYDNQAQRLKTICENAAENQWFYLNNVKGKSEQMAFLQALEEGQQIQMIDMPSCEKRTLFPAMIDGEGITTSIDRYPSAKNDEGYQYVVNMRNAAEDEEGNVIARIGWYNPDLTLDHYAKFNLGKKGEYFTPLINNVSLNPYLFDTDNEMEYIYIAKKRRTDGTNKIDNILEIAKEDGTILRTFRGDDDKSFRTASVVNMSDAKNELLVAYYDNNTQDYDLNFYELPFVKFAKGGNGSKENPYLISTVGDLSYMAAAPDSAYRLAADWSQQTTPVISHCVSTGTVNAEEPDETVHAIAGWTIANEYYEDGETPLEEKGLASNYSTAAPEGSADSSLDGAPVKVADLNDDFFKQMGYAFGQDTKAPWKSAETTPVLYFENTALVLTLSDNAVLLDNDADCYITATVYGQSADDITAVSDNSNVADVDIESREDGVATLHITSYKDGVANINVTVGTLTMACTVTVDHTLTTVKPLDKGQKLTILVTGNTISAPGATAITAYTLDGQVAAQSASTISALAKGLYIVKATDATGRQTTAKVMVK